MCSCFTLSPSNLAFRAFAIAFVNVVLAAIATVVRNPVPEKPPNPLHRSMVINPAHLRRRKQHMKNKVIALLAMLSLSGLSFAQSITGLGIASQYNNWRTYGTINLVAGANPLVPISPCVAVATGVNAVAASTPIRIYDPGNPSVDETITPTAIVVGSTCTATLTTANAHPQPWYIASGTYGLQDAINAVGQTSVLNAIVVDSKWHLAGGGASTIYNLTLGNPNLTIEDTSFKPELAYRWNGTHYVPNFSIDGIASPTLAAGAAAGTSPTVSNNAGSSGNSMTANVTTGTATTTGTLFTETVATAPPGGGILNCAVQSVGANNFPVPITWTATTTVLTVTVASAPPVSTAYIFNATCN